MDTVVCIQLITGSHLDALPTQLLLLSIHPGIFYNISIPLPEFFHDTPPFLSTPNLSFHPHTPFIHSSPSRVFSGHTYPLHAPATSTLSKQAHHVTKDT